MFMMFKCNHSHLILLDTASISIGNDALDQIVSSKYFGSYQNVWYHRINDRFSVLLPVGIDTINIGHFQGCCIKDGPIRFGDI